MSNNNRVPTDMVVDRSSGQKLDALLADNVSLINGQSISVKDKRFGAKGDGVTDDTLAIRSANEALNALGGGVLLFPTGTYIIGTFDSDGIGIKVHSNITYLGTGGTILRVKDGVNTPTSSWQGIFGSLDWGVSNASFLNITFHMNGDNNLYPQAFVNQGKRCGAIYFSNPFNILVRDCYFIKCPGINSISSGNASDFTVEHCTFNITGKAIVGNTYIYDHSCIMGTGDGYRIRNNRFINPSLCTISTASEIDCPNVVIEGNYFTNFNIGAIISTNGVVSVDNYILTNNIFDKNKTSISFWNYNSGSTIKNVKISNNKIIPYNAEDKDRFAIDLYTNVANPVSNIIIENNECHMDNAITADANYHRCIGIISQASDVIIRNNRIKNFTGMGILVRGTVTDIKIYNNVLIDNCNTTDSGEIYHIAISPLAGTYTDKIEIKNNHIENKNVTYAQYALFLLNDCRNINVINNTIVNITAFNFNGLTLTNTRMLNIQHVLSKNEQFFNLPASIYSSITNPFNGRKYIKKTNNLAVGTWNTEWLNGSSPGSGTESWIVGDIVFNTIPALNGYQGWICTFAGAPGTWHPFGLIST